VSDSLFINRVSLIKLLKSIDERSLIFDNSRRYLQFPDTLANSCDGDFVKFRILYNERFKVEGESIEQSLDDVSVLYLRNFSWILRYYLDTVPAWREAYLYWYAPLLIDLINCLERMDEKKWICIQTFQYLEGPFSPIEQLQRVISKTDKSLLPDDVSFFLDDESDFVEVDREGIPDSKEHTQIVKASFFPKSQVFLDERIGSFQSWFIICLDEYDLDIEKELRSEELPVDLEKIGFFNDFSSSDFLWGVLKVSDYSST
jgi:hypothetical protein